MTDQPLHCATWNIHRARGGDGRVDPDRVCRAIQTELVPLALDVLALQEADGECPPHDRILDTARVAQEAGLIYQHDEPHMRWQDQSSGFLGTILFLSPRLKPVHRMVVDLPGHCHRGAVLIEATCNGHPVRIVSAHLSLSQPLRVAQMRIIGQVLFRRPAMQTVLLGDFNEWRPWGGAMFWPQLVGQAFHGPAVRSFPCSYPILPLDRIMSNIPRTVNGVMSVKQPLVRQASDHLPVFGRVSLNRALRLSAKR